MEHEAADRQTRTDRQQLDVLAKVYRWAGYLVTILIVAGGGAAFTGLVLMQPPGGLGTAPAETLILGALVSLWIAATAIAVWALFRTSDYLRRGERYGFCFVTAIVVGGLTAPAGLALAIPTFIVLLRPSVREIFEDGHRAPAAVAPTSGLAS